MGRYFHVYAGVDIRNYPIQKGMPILGSAGTMLTNKSFMTMRHHSADFIHPEFIYLDSGGFLISQMEQRGELQNSKIFNRLTAEYIMKTANKVGATTVFALDFPLLGYQNKQQQKLDFQKKTPINLNLAREAINKHREICPTKELFLPLQFYNIDQLQYLINQLQVSPGSVGVAFPVRGLTVLHVIRSMIVLWYEGFHKVHLLGTSSLPYVVIAAYLARHHFSRVTTDSTTWMQTAQFLKYWTPGTMKAIRLDGRKCVKLPPCECQACRYYDLNHFWKMPRTELSYALASHNVAVFEQLCRDIFNACESLAKLSAFIGRVKFHGTVKKKLDVAIRVLSFFDGEIYDC